MKPCPALAEALGLDAAAPAVVALVGGGGKTTAMFGLARELKTLGKKVLVTTTTNIAVPEPDQCDILMLEGCADAAVLADVKPGTVVCLGGGLKNAGEVCKVLSVDPAFIDELCAKLLFDCILVEADGAKRKPIKAPADYEPVIPKTATAVIGVIGLDALGKNISEDTIHRCELFCACTGKKPGGMIDRESIVRLIMSENGLFKSSPAASRKVVLLNKADTAELQMQAELIARELARLQAGFGCIAASLQQGRFYTLS
jgi:probable selenium-dependent hydroxylase accessory protein YqeC